MKPQPVCVHVHTLYERVSIGVHVTFLPFYRCVRGQQSQGKQLLQLFPILGAGPHFESADLHNA